MKYKIAYLLLILTTFSQPILAENKSLIIAGGCFWCVESDYEKVPGVISAVSGYINGTVENPTYKQVSSKTTGHYEVVKVTYDTNKVSLRELTDYFWKTIDPTDDKGQFCDKGSPYYTGLFYQDAEQQAVFQASLASVNKTKPFKAPIVTKILPAEIFYPAEEYHQDFYKKSKFRYTYYRKACGRDSKIKKLWGEVASKQYR